MPQVYFYKGQESVLLLSCRVLEKAYQENHNAYVLVPDDETARELDALLWTFHDTSFIPHHIIGVQHDPVPAVEIGCVNQHPYPQHRDILLNLTAEVPTCVSEFERVIEIVPIEEEHKKRSRERYRWYQEQGFEIKVVEV